MPKGSCGENRPADVIGCAVRVAQLSVGLDMEELREPSGRLRSGLAGAESLMVEEERRQISKNAAEARWG